MKLKILLHLVIELSHLQTLVYMPPIWKGDKNTPSAFYCWGVKTIRFSVCFAFKAMSLWNTVSMTATFRVLLKCSIIMIHYVCLLSPTFMVRIPSHTFFPVMDQKPDRSFQNSLQWQPSRKVHHECNQNRDFLCSTSAPWRNWGRTSWTMVSTSGFTRYYKVTGLFFLGTNDTNSLHSLSQQNPIVGFAFMTLFVPLCRRCKVQVVRKKFPHSYQKI